MGCLYFPLRRGNTGTYTQQTGGDFLDIVIQGMRPHIERVADKATICQVARVRSLRTAAELDNAAQSPSPSQSRSEPRFRRMSLSRRHELQQGLGL